MRKQSQIALIILISAVITCRQEEAPVQYIQPVLSQKDMIQLTGKNGVHISKQSLSPHDFRGTC